MVKCFHLKLQFTVYNFLEVYISSDILDKQDKDTIEVQQTIFMFIVLFLVAA